MKPGVVRTELCSQALSARTPTAAYPASVCLERARERESESERERERERETERPDRARERVDKSGTNRMSMLCFPIFFPPFHD